MLSWLRIAVVGIFLPTAVAYAVDRGQPSKDELSGTFSSVCLQAETGDLIGTEISFIPSFDGVSLLFQNFEGQPLRPTLFFVSKPRNNKIEINSKNGGVSFNAQLYGDDKLKLRFTDGQVTRTGASEETLMQRVPTWGGGKKQIPVCATS